MKLLYLLSSICISTFLIAQQALQPNDFRIGMFGNPGKFKPNTPSGCDPVPYDTKFDIGNNKTSCLNVFSEDGFNTIQTYAPNIYDSEDGIKNLIKLTGDNGMKILLSTGLFYKGTFDSSGNHLGYGTNTYDSCGNASIPPCRWLYSYSNSRPNYINLFNNVFSQTPYNNFIWGYHISEEGSYLHATQNTSNCIGIAATDYKNAEVPPRNVTSAISTFKTLLAAKGITNHKMEVMPANHNRSIYAGTVDWETDPLLPNYFKPQDYIVTLKKEDVFFEGSYIHPPKANWYEEKYNDIKTPTGWHRLGFLKTIDYAKEFTKEVHDIINIENQVWSPGLIHTNDQIKNGNMLWFQSYSSIIHGAKGIWFFAYDYSYSNCDKINVLLENTGTNGITANSIIIKVRSYYPNDAFLTSLSDAQITCSNLTIIPSSINGETISDLVGRAADELRNGIVNQFDRKYFSPIYKNYVSNLSKELSYLVKKDILSTDPSTILYTKTDGPDPNCIVPSIPAYPAQSYIKQALTNLGATWATNPTYATELCSENYGLRYTIRTNGTETYMIITNPLNLPVTNVNLDFSNVANPIIKNSTGVEVLFDNGSNAVTSLNYKALYGVTNNRNSNIDLTTLTVGSKYSLSYTGNKQLNLSFGPYDAKVIKFVSTPLPNYEYGWTNTWSNFGNGNIGGHVLKTNDLVYPGDFDGGGDEEILIVNNTGSASDKMSMLKFLNGSWTLKWTNTAYSYEHGMFAYRANLIVGDFDGNGTKDLLGNMPLPSGWTTLFKYNTNTKDWDWVWSDGGNVSNHPIRPYKSKMYAVDFTGNGTDEILGCDLTTSGFTKEIRWNGAGFVIPIGGWSDNANHAIRQYRDNLYTGNFDGAGGGELLGLKAWGTLFDFKNGDWNWAWTTGSTGSFGGWGYPLNTTDKVIIGNIDNDTKDELMLFQTGTNASWATTFDISFSPTQWNWLWSTHNTNPAIPFIDDWPLFDNGGSDTRYYFIKPINNQPKQLLALRKYGCNSSYFVSMYKPNNPYANYKTIGKKNEENQLQDDNTVLIFPNPANELITVKINGELQNNIITIHDMQGRQKLALQPQKAREISVNISELAKGIYIIKVKNDSFLVSRKLIIQ